MKSSTKLVKEWMQKGRNDLRNAEVLFKEGGTIDAVCSHSQQAVEKYLKAFLVFHKLPAKKIHSLVILIKQGAKKEKMLLDFIDECKILEAYYIETRYPPDISVYNKKEGEQAYNLA
jgi:HEPN domain-containing protein